MRPLRFRVVIGPIFSLLLLALATANCGENPTNDAPVSMVSEKSEQVVVLLENSQLSTVASQMHYPELWTAEQRAEDRMRFEASLAAILNEMGTIRSHRPSEHKGPFLQIVLAGGDDSYWETHPQGGQALTAHFAVEFAKAGPGFVRVEFIEDADAAAIRSLGLGVAAERADARETMGRVLEVLQEDNGQTESPAASGGES